MAEQTGTTNINILLALSDTSSLTFHGEKLTRVHLPAHVCVGSSNLALHSTSNGKANPRPSSMACRTRGSRHLRESKYNFSTQPIHPILFLSHNLKVSESP
ncbi:hypothetical protein EYC84_005567 [Monilinia fructicola]|uniref:Uncharacterized protein n=1 Tax=Monilinia fructicola TaxID=38448 RepID=A0A5M9JZT3_MONFR|nr:hypothetical protein EYC84_005567 [Monilinia fructicola]